VITGSAMLHQAVDAAEVAIIFYLYGAQEVRTMLVRTICRRDTRPAAARLLLGRLKRGTNVQTVTL
jgi:hypothetical protein